MVMADGEDVSLALLLAEASRWAAARDDLESSLRPLTDLAVDTVCEFASITQRQDDGSFTTWAASDVRAVQADVLQYRLQEGPSVDASVHAGRVTSAAIALDHRWPGWRATAAKLGVEAVVSVHLYTDEAGLGALNLYSPTPRYFTADGHEAATLIGAHASVAMARFRASRRCDDAGLILMGNPGRQPAGGQVYSHRSAATAATMVGE